MNKIRSIHQLKAEKKRLEEEQASLERKLRDQWTSLKKAVRPGQKEKDISEDNADRTSTVFAKSAMQAGLSWLAAKLADRAGDKLAGIFTRKK
ncbi:MAG: hypothetical protein NTW29_22575 [Bacteroidetes bacterium]|nr:hypothetical protein [Bacteroidota bacterium]